MMLAPAGAMYAPIHYDLNLSFSRRLSVKRLSKNDTQCCISWVKSSEIRYSRSLTFIYSIFHYLLSFVFFLILLYPLNGHGVEELNFLDINLDAMQITAIFLSLSTTSFLLKIINIYIANIPFKVLNIN